MKSIWRLRLHHTSNTNLETDLRSKLLVQSLCHSSVKGTGTGRFICTTWGPRGSMWVSWIRLLPSVINIITHTSSKITSFTDLLSKSMKWYRRKVSRIISHLLRHYHPETIRLMRSMMSRYNRKLLISPTYLVSHSWFTRLSDSMLVWREDSTCGSYHITCRTDVQRLWVLWLGGNHCHRIYGRERVNTNEVTITTWQSVYQLDRSFFEEYDVIIGDENTCSSPSLWSVSWTSVTTSSGMVSQGHWMGHRHTSGS